MIVQHRRSCIASTMTTTIIITTITIIVITITIVNHSCCLLIIIIIINIILILGPRLNPHPPSPHPHNLYIVEVHSRRSPESPRAASNNLPAFQSPTRCFTLATQQRRQLLQLLVEFLPAACGWIHSKRLPKQMICSSGMVPHSQERVDQ